MSSDKQETNFVGFDMTKTKVGDKLITRSGVVATVESINHACARYKWKLEGSPFHYGKLSVDSSGFQWFDDEPTDLDIVGFADPQPDPDPVIENKGVKNDSGKPNMMLTQNAAERKQIPIVTGLIDYFPLALAEVAKCSKIANEQHNPGSELHWDRTKSTDHIDCIGRHLIDRNSSDTDGVQHDVKLAWRALAYLQLRLENEKGKSK